MGRIRGRMAWTACFAVLALAAAFVALAAGPSELEPQPAVGQTCEAAPLPDGAEPAIAQSESLDVGFDLAPLDAQPAAICRMAPECDTNADCDAICGAGQGRCGHSRCPIRVCKCS